MRSSRAPRSGQPAYVCPIDPITIGSTLCTPPPLSVACIYERVSLQIRILDLLQLSAVGGPVSCAPHQLHDGMRSKYNVNWDASLMVALEHRTWGHIIESRRALSCRRAALSRQSKGAPWNSLCVGCRLASRDVPAKQQARKGPYTAHSLLLLWLSLLVLHSGGAPSPPPRGGARARAAARRRCFCLSNWRETCASLFSLFEHRDTQLRIECFSSHCVWPGHYFNNRLIKGAGPSNTSLVAAC